MNKAFELPQAASKGDYLVITGTSSRIVPRAEFHAIMLAAKEFTNGQGEPKKKLVAPPELIAQEKRLCLGILLAADEPFSAGDVRDNLKPGRISRPSAVPARLEALVREGNVQKIPVPNSRNNLYAVTAKGKRTYESVPA